MSRLRVDDLGVGGRVRVGRARVGRELAPRHHPGVGLEGVRIPHAARALARLLGVALGLRLRIVIGAAADARIGVGVAAERVDGAAGQRERAAGQRQLLEAILPAHGSRHSKARASARRARTRGVGGARGRDRDFDVAPRAGYGRSSKVARTNGDTVPDGTYSSTTNPSVSATVAPIARSSAGSPRGLMRTPIAASAANAFGRGGVRSPNTRSLVRPRSKCVCARSGDMPVPCHGVSSTRGVAVSAPWLPSGPGPNRTPTSVTPIAISEVSE